MRAWNQARCAAFAASIDSLTSSTRRFRSTCSGSTLSSSAETGLQISIAGPVPDSRMYAAQPSIPATACARASGSFTSSHHDHPSWLYRRFSEIATPASSHARTSAARRSSCCIRCRSAFATSRHSSSRQLVSFSTAAASPSSSNSAIASMRSRVMSSPASSTAARARRSLAAAPFGMRPARSTRSGSTPSSSICCTPRLRSTSVRGRLSSVATMATIALASSMSSHTTAWQRASLFLHMAL